MKLKDVLNEINAELVRGKTGPAIKLIDINGKTSEIELVKNEDGKWTMDSNLAETVPRQHRDEINLAINAIFNSGKWKEYSVDKNPPDIIINKEKNEIIFNNDETGKRTITKLDSLMKG